MSNAPFAPRPMNRLLPAVLGVAIVAFAASTADAASAYAYARAKDSSANLGGSQSASGFFTAYANRSASVPGAAAGAWARSETFKKRGGGYGYLKTSATTNKSYQWKWSASTTHFVVDGPAGVLAEINLIVPAVTPNPWDGSSPEFPQFLPAVQSFFVDSFLTVDMMAVGSIHNITDGTSQTLFEGGANMGGPTSATPRLLATGDFIGAFTPMMTVDGRNSAMLDGDFMSIPVRVPTNTHLFWSMEFTADTHGDDPTFDLNFDGDGFFGSGAWFDLELALVSDPAMFSLRAIPEPAVFGTAMLAMLCLGRRRRA